MDRIWAPWRSGYVTGSAPRAEGCIFCDKPKAGDDAAEHVLWRGEFVFALMNLYPYNGGHIMVAPYRHAGCLTELDDDEAGAVLLAARSLVPAMRDALRPDGFNMGFNIGRAGGAGMEQHLHFHIVPRWNGDSNFLAAAGDTRVISEGVDETYSRLRDAISRACVSDVRCGGAGAEGG